jgi:hypothetical protein
MNKLDEEWNDTSKDKDMSTKTNSQYLQFLSEALCRVAAELPRNFLLENDELFWFHYHLLTGGKLSAKSTYQITNFDKWTGILVASHMYCLLYFSEEEVKEDKAGYYVVFQDEPGQMSMAGEREPSGEPVGVPCGEPIHEEQSEGLAGASITY